MLDLQAIYDSRKSFYGKAKIFEENGVIYLQSYDTIVSKYENGVVEELGKWSQTTTRHQKEFRKQIENGDLFF